MKSTVTLLFATILCAATTPDWASYSLKDQAIFLQDFQYFLTYSSKALQHHSHSKHWPHIYDTLTNIRSETTRDLNACVIAFFDAASQESDAHDSDDTTDLLSRPKVTKTPSRLTPTDLFKNGKFHKEVQKLIKRYATGPIPQAIPGRENFYRWHTVLNGFDQPSYLLVPIHIIDKRSDLSAGQTLTRRQADDMIFPPESNPTIERALATKNTGAQFIYAEIPLRRWWRDSTTFHVIEPYHQKATNYLSLQKLVERSLNNIALVYPKPQAR